MHRLHDIDSQKYNTYKYELFHAAFQPHLVHENSSRTCVTPHLYTRIMKRRQSRSSLESHPPNESTKYKALFCQRDGDKVIKHGAPRSAPKFQSRIPVGSPPALFFSQAYFVLFLSLQPVPRCSGPYPPIRMIPEGERGEQREREREREREIAAWELWQAVVTD